MKITASLSNEDLEFAYEAASREWSDSAEDQVWDLTVADGLTSCSD